MKTIALLTDFGTRDYFVGAMKGVILSICRPAQIIDITHEIAAQNIASASFTLRACYRNFPVKTIFVAVVDPGVGSNRRAILVETEEYFFVAPDNGLLSFVFNESGNPSAGVKNSFRVYELTDPEYFAESVSRTFHGRDIFAPVAAHLANGVETKEFGVEIFDFVRSKEIRPQKIDVETIAGAIIHTDRFGNLITNFRLEDLPGKFSVEINGKRVENLQTYFAEAEQGEIFMIVGSAGFLEIVAFRDSAEKLLQAEVGAAVFVTRTN